MASRHTAFFLFVTGEVNNGFVGDGQSLSGSRKSLSLQPVMMLPQVQTMANGDEQFSDFGHRARNPYAPNIQNFQL